MFFFSKPIGVFLGRFTERGPEIMRLIHDYLNNWVIIQFSLMLLNELNTERPKAHLVSIR